MAYTTIIVIAALLILALLLCVFATLDTDLHNQREQLKLDVNKPVQCEEHHP